MHSPTHPKGSLYLRRGIFDGLKNFRELEARISGLATAQERGEAFEVFAEAYLATQRQQDAEKVWPLSVVPIDLLQRLGLSEQDYGVDGIFRTLLGNHNAYQVKFRSLRTPLTWRELSTFMGLADSAHIRSRVLFTNCDELPALLNERRGFFCIRGSDLDRLQPKDFRAIESWFAGVVFRTPKKKPQEHQSEALAALIPALQNEDRVSAIMACGTGKTLVALWVVEELQATKILVLLPSLALLRQTLHEWLRETNLPALAYLCVCSDPTVAEGIDGWATHQSDLDFEVSTDTNNVRQFLDDPFAGTKVVFTTYQSASIVGQAIKPGEMFDFGVFDEAHKTAGREGRNYGFALDNSNLPIRKRLFVTATPRHYNPHRRDGEGEAQVVFSMDNPKVYGRQVFCLSFGEAARRNIICNYKVVISVITSEMVTNELLTRGDVMVNGDAVRARQVANQIALRDAVEEYGIRKIFTFHRTVKSAGSFVADGSEGIRAHLPNFGSYHVNGDMPTARRERVMREFRRATRAVMSNARCLTEGVDVPTVDMVAFLSPRRSRVDIVQATGRAMRRAPGKALGYVLVPLYVELAGGESVEDAVRRSDFDEVMDVLQSLQEQDEALAELIRHTGELVGRGKGFDDRDFADRIDFGGPRLSLENLRTAVTTRCLENLYSSWDNWFGKLKAFKERFGHCNLETGWDDDPPLAGWVSAQRTRKNKGILSDERIARLDQLGFIWDYQKVKAQETWMKWYRELEAYAREHGNPHVPRNHSDTLANWVGIQRQRRRGTLKRKGKETDPMTPEQVSLLGKLSFRWDSPEQWMENFEKLKAYKAQHGHCNAELVGRDDAALARWVKAQRLRKSIRKPTPERKALLDSIGFNWSSETNARKWREMYDCLRQYHADHGDTEAPHRWKANPELGRWVHAQRQRRKSGLILTEQIELLGLLGFTWQHRQPASWDDRLAEVAAFKATHGHCDIPRVYVECPKLGGFVNAMRTKRKNGTLSADRVAKLDAVGFAWTSNRKAKIRIGKDGINVVWRARFDELLAYKQMHDNCDVPARWETNKQLANWVVMQRQLKKRGQLEPERVGLLEENGFAWQVGTVQKSWADRYTELLQFKSIHGSCNVPKNWPENSSLAYWVINQRQYKRLGKLSPEYERLLNEAGFVWARIINQKR